MDFKGLNKQGVWVYGHGFVPNGDSTSIIVDSINDIHDEFRIVEDSTVCIRTGIKDSDGKQVFYKDIIKISVENIDYFYVVSYDNKSGQFYLINSNVKFDVLNDSDLNIKFYVVGNANKDTEMLNRALKKVK